MFKNREISVQVSKAMKGEVDNIPAKEDISFTEKMDTVLYVGKAITYRVGLVVAAYIILDTRRQVKIAKNTTHIHITD